MLKFDESWLMTLQLMIACPLMTLFGLSRIPHSLFSLLRTPHSLFGLSRIPHSLFGLFRTPHSQFGSILFL